MIPPFELTWSFVNNTVSVRVDENAPELLKLDMIEVLRPFVGSAVPVKDPNEVLYTLRFHLESWLRVQVRAGDLFFDHLRGCWRYGL